MTTPDDDGQGLPPAETLALIAQQQERVRRALRPGAVAVPAMWGVAWLVGFGVCYLAAIGTGLPTWVAVVVTVALFAVAIALPVIQSARAGRGVTGPSQQVAAMYGASWGLAFGALTAINAALSDQAHLSGHAVTLLWSGTSLVVVGLLYLTGGALWREPVQYALGVWMLVVGAGSVFAGVPGNFLVLALAGGGGFLAMAAYYRLRRGDRNA
jgi:hypothetical protein